MLSKEAYPHCISPRGLVAVGYRSSSKCGEVFGCLSRSSEIVRRGEMKRCIVDCRGRTDGRAQLIRGRESFSAVMCQCGLMVLQRRWCRQSRILTLQLLQEQLLQAPGQQLQLQGAIVVGWGWTLKNVGKSLIVLLGSRLTGDRIA